MRRAILASLFAAAACGPSSAQTPSTQSTSASDSTGGEPTPVTSTTGDASASITGAPADTSGGLDDTGSSSGSSSGDAPPARGPSRVLFFYTPHGFFADQLYSGSGEDFTLGSVLGPLEPWRDHLLVVEGIDNVELDPEGIDVIDAHSMVSAALLTGGLLGSGSQGDATDFNPHYAGGPSLDLVLGESLSGMRPVASVHLGVRANPPDPLPLGVSYLGLDEPNPPMSSPELAFQSLFAGLEGEDLEALEATVMGIGADDPEAILDAQLSLVAATFAYDIARVQLLSIDTGIPRIPWDANKGVPFHMVLSLKTPQDAEPVYVLWGQSMATLLQMLDMIPLDGTRTVLDDTLVVWLTELGNPAPAHPRTPTAMIIDRSGTLVTGRVVPVKADQADFAVTIATVLGVDLGSFGHPGLDATPIEELFAR